MDAPLRGLDRATGAATDRAWTVPVALGGRRLELECRETLDDLQALRQEWQALERRSPEPFSYFQSFDWCMTWCRAFLSDAPGNAACPKVYVLWEDGQCLMIWPLMTRRLSPAVTVLVPLTAPMNQYATLLYDPAGFDLVLGRAVFDAIRKDGGADAICLDHVPQSALLARILDGQGFSPRVQQQSSILDLSGIPDWESHHRTLPKKQRLQRNSRRNRLEKLGSLDYRVLTPEGDGYVGHLDHCLAMKQDWLKGTGRLGRNVFDPRFAAFLRSLGQTAGPDEGQIFLHALTLDGVPIAMELGMRFQDHYYCFLGAIDLAYQNHSPGKVQMEGAQRWAIEQGIRRFDFLNDPSTYKSSWTNSTEPLAACYVPLTSLGQLYCRYWKAGLHPRLRALYDGVGPAWRSRVRGALDGLQRVLGRNGGTLGLMLCCMP
jgi:CelD/BcsL family acetyltransferase involved in cellulose biosynthesis